MKHKATLYLGMLLVAAMSVFADPGHGSINTPIVSSGAAMPAWVNIAIISVIVIGVWLAVRWWKKL